LSSKTEKRFWETRLSPEQVLKYALGIENLMGRKRERKWYTRLIDIDLLFFEQQIINTTDLTLPHPFLAKRNFVLTPLAEIAPNFIHPILKKSVLELFQNSIGQNHKEFNLQCTKTNKCHSFLNESISVDINFPMPF